MPFSKHYADFALPALRRATRNAYKDAAMRGLKIPIWQDGKVVYADPNELLKKSEEWEDAKVAEEPGQYSDTQNPERQRRA